MRHRHPDLRRETQLPPGSFELDSYRLSRLDRRQLIRWKRLPGKGRISGVCAGLAYRFGIRPWKVRLLFAAAFVFAAVFYLLAARVVPARRRIPKDFDARTG